MATDQIILRAASLNDLPEMKELYRGTIMEVCANDYDLEQCTVWASSAEKTERWNDLINNQYVVLAVKNNVIVGFGSLLNGNYLDFMYVHKDYQRQGIADTLLIALEAEALRQKAQVITSDISKTARPYFEKKGYIVLAAQENTRGDIVLVNYKMKKQLNSEAEVKQTHDYRLVAKLNKEVQGLHHRLYPEVFKPYDEEAVSVFFRDGLNNENTKAFIAYDNGEAAGYVLVFVKDFNENPFQYARRFLLIDQLLVAEKFRGKGIGKLLLDKVFEVAKELSVNHIRLNHWTLNKEARSFFSKHGFEYYSENMFREI